MQKEFEKLYIYGKHALEEALLYAPQVVKKVFFSTRIHDLELRNLIRKRGVTITELKEKDAPRMVGHDAAHQGIVAIVDSAALMIDFDDFVRTLEPTSDTLLVLLDELTDPHNVGAIIRSAAAFGASGVLMPYHNQAPVTGAVVKASAGMAFRIPIVSIGNVNYTIGLLKDRGFQVYGLEMKGSEEVTKETFTEPTLLIVGNEAKGIRQKTGELCDKMLRVPMHPRCESLNASVSVAVVLYEWSKEHPKALRGK
ncbi:MAG: 23S rRNA (guanosine(2251)-2'-O)-methyltransferase RlmB [Patescibacteria group bacterium]